MVEVQEGGAGLLEVQGEEPVMKKARRVTETDVFWESLTEVWGRSATSCSEARRRSRRRQ